MGPLLGGHVAVATMAQRLEALEMVMATGAVPTTSPGHHVVHLDHTRLPKLVPTSAPPQTGGFHRAHGNEGTQQQLGDGQRLRPDPAPDTTIVVTHHRRLPCVVPPVVAPIVVLADMPTPRPSRPYRSITPAALRVVARPSRQRAGTGLARIPLVTRRSTHLTMIRTPCDTFADPPLDRDGPLT